MDVEPTARESGGGATSSWEHSSDLPWAKCCVEGCSTNTADGGAREVILLPCFHVICSDPCSKKFLEVAQSTPGEASRLLCNLCKSVVTPEDLANKVNLNEEFPKVSLRTLNCEYCSEEPPPPAIAYCRDCKELLCEACTKYLHAAARKHKSHLVDRDLAEQRGEASTAKAGSCARHRDTPSTHYCFDCKEKLCQECLGNHRGSGCLSRVVDIQEERNTLEETLDDMGIWTFDEELNNNCDDDAANTLGREITGRTENDKMAQISDIKDAIKRNFEILSKTAQQEAEAVMMKTFRDVEANRKFREAAFNSSVNHLIIAGKTMLSVGNGMEDTATVNFLRHSKNLLQNLEQEKETLRKEEAEAKNWRFQLKWSADGDRTKAEPLPHKFFQLDYLHLPPEESSANNVSSSSHSNCGDGSEGEEDMIDVVGETREGGVSMTVADSSTTGTGSCHDDTTMLMDVESGRDSQLDQLHGSPQEMGNLIIPKVEIEMDRPTRPDYSVSPNDTFNNSVGAGPLSHATPAINMPEITPPIAGTSTQRQQRDMTTTPKRSGKRARTPSSKRLGFDTPASAIKAPKLESEGTTSGETRDESEENDRCNSNRPRPRNSTELRNPIIVMSLSSLLFERFKVDGRIVDYPESPTSIEFEQLPLNNEGEQWTLHAQIESCLRYRKKPNWDKRAHPEDDDKSCFICMDSKGKGAVCCYVCPRIFHLECHIPPLAQVPSEDDWRCNVCQTKENVEEQIGQEGSKLDGNCELSERNHKNFSWACKFLMACYKIPEIGTVRWGFPEGYRKKYGKLPYHLHYIREKLLNGVGHPKKRFQNVKEMMLAFEQMFTQALVYYRAWNTHGYAVNCFKQFVPLVEDYYPRCLEEDPQLFKRLILKFGTAKQKSKAAARARQANLKI